MNLIEIYHILKESNNIKLLNNDDGKIDIIITQYNVFTGKQIEDVKAVLDPASFAELRNQLHTSLKAITQSINNLADIEADIKKISK